MAFCAADVVLNLCYLYTLSLLFFHPSNLEIVLCVLFLLDHCYSLNQIEFGAVWQWFALKPCRIAPTPGARIFHGFSF